MVSNIYNQLNYTDVQIHYVEVAAWMTNLNYLQLSMCLHEHCRQDSRVGSNCSGLHSKWLLQVGNIPKISKSYGTEGHSSKCRPQGIENNHHIL